MRPVSKGHKGKEYKSYQDAKRDLFEAIGSYCSYCEREISHLGAVEHVQPKSNHPDKECSWDNFLLGCVNCNSTKGDTEINDSNIDDYVWPDKNDTYHLISYDPVTLIPSAAGNLPDEIKTKVQNLIELVGLDKAQPKEGTLDYQRASDLRVEKRKEVKVLADRYKQFYIKLDEEAKQDFLDPLQELVRSKGYWSIWMHTFEDIPEIREMLLDAIPGTNKAFF